MSSRTGMFSDGALAAFVEVQKLDAAIHAASRIVKAKHKGLDDGRIMVAINNTASIQALRADRAYWMMRATMFASLAAMP